MKSAPKSGRQLIFPAHMAEIDARTIAGGTPGIVLMERAGQAVVTVLRGVWTRRSVLILAGPGNNGGDGWVIARLLKEAGWPVTIVSDWPASALKGDAKLACEASGMTPVPLERADFSGSPLIVDALFGAGLVRPIEGKFADVLRRAAESAGPVLAVDLPSGLCGTRGEVLGDSLKADVTVTFGAAKPGHLLAEGRHFSGELHVVDIGLGLREGEADALWNHPLLWRDHLPLPPSAAHKYTRGGLLVVGGPRHQGGAARLTAKAAAVTGAGAVTLAVSPQAADIYAASIDAIMLRTVRDESELADLAASDKIAAIAIGPGLGTDEKAAAWLEAVLSAGKPLLLDADAFTLLSKRGERLAGCPEGSVLTPHEGEFKRLFPDVSGSPLERAEEAACKSGQTVLLKGAATVISAPGKTPVINTHSSPYLATAGSGDVLSGIIAGWLAQGVDSHMAAGAGAWIHGESALQYGPGLTADSLWQKIPNALHVIGARTDD